MIHFSTSQPFCVCVCTAQCVTESRWKREMMEFISWRSFQEETVCFLAFMVTAIVSAERCVAVENNFDIQVFSFCWAQTSDLCSSWLLKLGLSSGSRWSENRTTVYELHVIMFSNALNVPQSRRLLIAPWNVNERKKKIQARTDQIWIKDLNTRRTRVTTQF